MAHKKAGYDENGKLKIEEVGAPVAAVSGVSLHSFFDDDEGENLESGFVMLDGQKVWVRELTASEAGTFQAAENEIAVLMDDLRKAEDAATAEALGEQIKARRIAAYDGVIVAAVAKWELKRPDGSDVPCTEEMKRKLRVSKKAELCDKIAQRSAIGRDLSAFLAD